LVCKIEWQFIDLFEQRQGGQPRFVERSDLMRHFHRSLESELSLLSLPQASKSDSMGDKRSS
jgi:hypothetical protein